MVSNPVDDANACDDFFDTIVTSYILVACMRMLDMDTLSDVPTQKEYGFTIDSWMKSNSDRRSTLYYFCQCFVEKHVDFSYQTVNERSKDEVTNYVNEVICLGLFYFNYKDAIQGDGERIKNCWKYLLPIFKASDRRNYSGEVLCMLYNYHHTFSPRQAQQLLYSRFVNVHGLPGRNIAADLHMEHLNRACKDAIRGLGTNKTKKSITRIGKAIGPLMDITSNYDQSVLNKVRKSNRHKVEAVEKDKRIVMNELMGRAKVVDEVAGRRRYRHCCELKKSLPQTES